MSAEGEAAQIPLLSPSLTAPAKRRHAYVTLLILALLFAVAAPFAHRALPRVWAFIPLYQSAVVVNELLTAVLLYGLFSAARAPALLVLAAGYVFTATMAVAHLLSFPGLFAPAGVIGGGVQTTAWLYFFWHLMFPLFIFGYVILTARPVRTVASGDAGVAVRAGGMLAAIGAAAGFTLLATAGHDLLPQIMAGDGDLAAKYIVAWATCLVGLVAAAALWCRRPHSILDLWLLVAVSAGVFEVALAAVFNAGRFSLGFYAGRIYGLAAASFLLVVLILETGRLYARLLESQRSERRQAGRALARQAERLRVLHEIDRAAVIAKAPQAIAQAAVGPLRDLLGVPRTIVNRFDLAAGEVIWLAAAGRRREYEGPTVRYSIRLMGELDALKRGEPQLIDTLGLPASPESGALLASGVRYYMVMPMIAGGELIGALSFGGETAEFSAEQMVIAREAAMQLAVATSQAQLLERVMRQTGELELRVRERTADLESANRELEAFSYTVSHDLRSPLRAIDGYSQMLEEDYGATLDAEARRLIGVVRANATHMARLIEDLLRFSQLGRKPVTRLPFDMGALAREVAGELGPAHGRAQIEVGALPAADGDRALLKQVWTNLVGNALKYSAHHPEPRISLGGQEADGESIYWVRDNGAGFDMRYADKLFRVFQRLHRSDEFEGTGVGLAIVQRVVSRHEGRVWAEGEVGRGACFYFSLPRRP